MRIPPITQKILTEFEALPDDEQLIVLALAVHFTPIGQVSLQSFLAQSGLLNETSLQKIGRALKLKCQKTGLVHFPPGGWLCERSISEILMKRAVKNKVFFARLSTIISETITSESDTVLNRIKRLRIYLYEEDVRQFLSDMNKIQLEFPQHYNDTLQRLFFNGFDEAWFSGLDERIRFLALKYYLDRCCEKFERSLFHEKLFEKYFSNFIERSVPIALRYIEFCLYKSQMDLSMVAYLNKTPSVESFRLLGTYYFFQNDHKKAVYAYEKSLARLKKQVKKRNITIFGLDGQFYYLALLKIRSAESLAILRKQLIIAIKTEQTEFTYQNHRLLEGLDIYQGKKNTDECRYLFKTPYLQGQKETPYSYLFQALLLYWLDEAERVFSVKENRVLKNLQVFCKTAHTNNYEWFAAVSALLLDKLDTKNSAPSQRAIHYQNSPFADTLNFLPRVQEWERALMALNELNSPPNPINALSLTRIIWQLSLDSHDITLIPREQKMSKTGRWTKGRPIALNRLSDEMETFSYLSHQDKQICQQISTYQEDYYYGYRAKDIYFLGGKGLLAAVGHPHVYWESDQKISTVIDVVKAEPQLLVKEQGESFHISLIPKIENGSDVYIERSTTGVLVYDITEQHYKIVQILTPEGLIVPSSARQDVIDTIASITSILTIQSDIGGASVHAKMVDADSRLHVHLQPVGEGLDIEVFIQPFLDGGPVYKPTEGGETVLAEIEGTQLQTCRDFSLEKKYLKALMDECPALYRTNDYKWQMDDLEIALETLLQLQGLGDFALLEWPKGKCIKLNQELGLSAVRFSIRKEKNWFEVEGEDIALDEANVLKMQKLLELLQGTRGRFLKLENGQFIALTDELRRRLDDFSGLGDAHGERVRFHPLATPALKNITQGMTLNVTKSWKDQLKSLSEMSELVLEVPSTLQGDLRDYQKEGYQWMCRLAHWGAGACLADDMGLGKTIQALALILSRAKGGATLILAPTSVCMNWLEEALRFAPTLKVQQFGTGERQKMLDEAGAFDLIVCSYGLLQSEGERLAEKRWHTVVADEAQAIKNMQTKRSKAAMALQADFKLITTGTPIENHLGELWNLFNFINPGLFGSLENFNQKYAISIENTHDYATQQRLKKLLRPFILRRLKSDVLTELPPKTEITLHIEQSPEEKAMYEALRRTAVQTMTRLNAKNNQGQRHLQVLAEIMKLRRACCNPSLVMEGSSIASTKLAAFEELVTELIEGKHKVLVFSQFIGHLSIIREALDKKGMIYQYLDGSTSIAKRKKAVNAFQAGEGDLFLISLKAGGAGLNLTAADYVIHMDPWWNPAVEDQASDRAHRMGQTRAVTIYRLVAKNTIEDKIVELHKHKRDLANNLLEGGEISGKMSVDEILNLIQNLDDA